jgi:hypothetical protein
MYIEEIKPGFPDCIGRRFTGKGWEKVNIEFEYKSSNFKDHSHNPDDCDIIVCWEHNWQDCPIEVIELREIIKTLPTRPIKRPSNVEEKHSTEELFKRRKVSEETQKLYQVLDEKIKSINDEIWSKIAKTTISYYSPERVFLYTWFRKNSIAFDIYTGGEIIEGVKTYPSEKVFKWGSIKLRNKSDIPKVLTAIKKSYNLIKEAIRKNEPTGWYAPIDEAEKETEEE